MGETTSIAWTDATINFWWGCTEVGPGCDHCYARTLANRLHPGHWGSGAPRYRVAGAAALARKLQRKAEREHRRIKVFGGSMCDPFDNEIDNQWRQELYAMIDETPDLDWQLVTKRIGNVEKMVPLRWERGGFPPNVWIIASICNQQEADRDLPKLIRVPASVRGVSYEPALGPVNFDPWRSIDWIIIGGESIQGGKCRLFNTVWAESVLRYGRGRTAVFVKQLGSAAFHNGHRLPTLDKAGADPAEWPANLQVREFPTPRWTTISHSSPDLTLRA